MLIFTGSITILNDMWDLHITTFLSIPEDSILHTHCHEDVNLAKLFEVDGGQQVQIFLADGSPCPGKYLYKDVYRFSLLIYVLIDSICHISMQISLSLIRSTRSYHRILIELNMSTIPRDLCRVIYGIRLSGILIPFTCRSVFMFLSLLWIYIHTACVDLIGHLQM
jgi:hypothetical protein